MPTPIPTSPSSPMSVRGRAALRAAGITTMEAACALSDEQLLALDGMGPATVKLLRLWEADPEAALAPKPAAPLATRLESLAAEVREIEEARAREKGGAE